MLKCVHYFFSKKLKMLDCFLAANSSFKTKDSKRCKSRRTSSPLLLKNINFVKFPVHSRFLFELVCLLAHQILPLSQDYRPHWFLHLYLTALIPESLRQFLGCQL